MAKKNIFDGDSWQAIFSRLLYKRLMTGEILSNTMIMEANLSLSKKYGEKKNIVSKVTREEAYGELKKAFRELHKLLEEKCPGGLKIIGSNRNRQYCYCGEVKDPLGDMFNASVICDLKKYWQFCQDSAGFFPTSWLNHFFKGTQDLLDIKTSRSRGQQYIYSSLDRALTNIERLPEFYEYVKGKKVLKMEYAPFYDEVKIIEFHPHLLREYNGRWQIYGFSEDLNPKMGYGISIDRIGKVEVVKDVTFAERPQGFYEDRFKYLVGLTIKEHKQVIVRAHSEYFWGLFKTKPLPNYKVVKDFGNYEDGQYGDFEIDVTLNDEFFGRILQFSPGLEIISPADVREKFAARVKETFERYK